MDNILSRIDNLKNQFISKYNLDPEFVYVPEDHRDELMNVTLCYDKSNNILSYNNLRIVFDKNIKLEISGVRRYGNYGEVLREFEES